MPITKIIVVNTIVFSFLTPKKSHVDTRHTGVNAKKPNVSRKKQYTKEIPIANIKLAQDFLTEGAAVIDCLPFVFFKNALRLCNKPTISSIEVANRGR